MAAAWASDEEEDLNSLYDEQMTDQDHDDDDDGNGDNGSELVLSAELTSYQIQGCFEAEICCGDETDLHRHYNECEKNPGHEQFIPADEFTVDRLPVEYRDNDIANLIKALSDITVLINVKFTSKKRPNTCPDGKVYPFSILKGHTNMRSGSGWVWRVNIFSTREYNGKKCPCKACRRGPNPQTQWAVIDIYTVTHHVYDEREGAHATCYFFFDSKNDKLKKLPSLCQATRVHSNLDGDASTLTYITHDIVLAMKLLEKWRLYKSLHTSVGEKYNTSENDGQIKSDTDNHRLTVIVSHPHGLSKQISIGYYTQREEMDYNDAYTKYTYTTPTCMGSSGAPVYVLSRWWWWGCDHPHSGCLEDNKGLNYSGIAMY